MAPINYKLQDDALAQCIKSDDDKNPLTTSPTLQPSDFRVIHMNEEQLCDPHEHNKATGGTNCRVERAINTCLVSDNQKINICDVRDIL